MPAKGQRVPLLDRLLKRSVKKPNGCIEWTGVKTPKGYGVLKYNTSSRQQAHRVSWIAHHGGIPEGMCVLHKCDNPACFNIEHLFLGTKGDNNTDRHVKGRSRNQHTGRLQGDCPHGVRQDGVKPQAICVDTLKLKKKPMKSDVLFSEADLKGL